MKLIFCKHCWDVVKLHSEVRFCRCEKCWGKYEKDGLNAIISKEAIPVGINNFDFAQAVLNQPEFGMGERFEAFVIPKICPTIKVEN